MSIILDKIIDNIEDIVFVIIAIAIVLYLLPVPLPKTDESDNQREIEYIVPSNISWIGLKEVQNLKYDKVILLQDYEKGVYILVTVEGDSVTKYYVNSNEVSSIKKYID